MFARLAAVVFARRKLVLLVGLVAILAAGAWGGSVTKRLSGGGYYDPHSESVAAANDIQHKLGVPASDATVLFTSQRPITDPQVGAAISRALQNLPSDAVTSYVSYWNSHRPELVSADGHATYANLELAGSTDPSKQGRVSDVERSLAAADLPGITVGYAGVQPLNKEISHQVSVDLKRAETLSLPIVLILLVFIFGSLVSAALPVVVGVCGIIGAFAILRVLTLFVSVSVFAQNMVTLLGLGLAIDYALFVVSRFREEMDRQGDVETAIRRTLATAGRTVAFSGVTVAVSAASLTLFPESFLRSMGYGGVAVVLLDVLAALTVLPALLAVLGRRVDALRVPLGRGRRGGRAGSGDPPDGVGRLERDAEASGAELAHGAWYRLAHSVMRHPVLYAVPIVVVLLFMASPFRNVTFGGYTAKVMPAGASGRVVTETLSRDFPGNDTQPMQVVVEGLQSPAALTTYVSQLQRVSGVRSAQVTARKADNALVKVDYDGDPISGKARATLAGIRTVTPPPGSRVLVGGLTAFLVDQLHSIGQVLPWMLGIVVVAMAVLLFFAFGSFVLPVKAILMNTLSIGASFGAITWIFQSGHLSSVLNFTPLGYLDATDPILLLAVVFGLSMDYEVFLLSRIREEWDSLAAPTNPPLPPGERNRTAVAVGVQRSGRIITSAALLLVVVIGLFATSRITTLKLLGVGMALAIALDATIVRALLVPAVMRMLGAANWWAPAPVARWWAAHGLRETAQGAPPPRDVRELQSN